MFGAPAKKVTKSKKGQKAQPKTFVPGEQSAAAAKPASAVPTKNVVDAQLAFKVKSPTPVLVFTLCRLHLRTPKQWKKLTA